MARRLSFIVAAMVAGLFLGGLVIPAQEPGGDSLDELREQAIQAAAQKAAPSIVQIETSGGTDIIGTGPRGPQIRKGIGPTTGVIVAADGYIITSAFNFANKPSDIRVNVPGKGRHTAKVVATDHTRMLTLLKIDAKELAVPTAVPKKEIQVGQTALALGRTFDNNMDNPPSLSTGIISAVGRIWGKAIQTDAKVSPVNYGGPLVDLQGRVQGILVPASPRGEDETAGFEWYDSGIGFAIPLEDINAVLPKLREGKDLRKGLLGITPKSGNLYSGAPEVATVAADSAAARAGIKPGDIIKEIDGHPVANQAQVMHRLGNKYEGDTVSLKILRGKEEIALPNIVLSGTLKAFAQAFLGILAMRDDPELGVEVRYVYPKSPADIAGLKVGDRITKLGTGNNPPQPFTGIEASGRDQLLNFLSTQAPGTEIKLEVTRKEGKKTETLTVKLGELPNSVPDKLPEPATFKKALEPRKTVGGPMPPKDEKKDEKKDDKKKPETGLLERTNQAKDHQYWIYVPDDYDPNIAYALVIWLHPVGKGKEEDVKIFRNTWRDICADNHVIVLAPKAENDTGWLPSEADFIREAARDVLASYTIDRKRVVAHGMGVGGQMGFYLGFAARDLIRGVATTGAPAVSVKDNVAGQPVSIYMVAGGKDPLRDAIFESQKKVSEKKFSVIYREIPEMGSQYLDEKTLEELARWVDSLDRL
jgi:S1-C subfamily serine protease/predicted esterase